GQWVCNEVTDFCLGIQPLRLSERDLSGLVLDSVSYFAEPQQPDLAVLAIDLRANIVFLAVFGAAGFLDRLLHCLQDFVAVDSLIASDSIGDLQQFRARIGDGGVHGVLRVRWQVRDLVWAAARVNPRHRAAPPRSDYR